MKNMIRVYNKSFYNSLKRMKRMVKFLLKRMFIFLWFSRSKIPFLNFPIPVPLPYGGWFLCYGDVMGASVFLYKFTRERYEENYWKFVQQFLKPGMIFFDIGANQGFYTILASKLVGPEGKVFAFEPAPTEFRKLKLNILINRLKNVVVEPLALGSREGSSDFYLVLNGKGSFSSLRPPAKDVNARTKLIKVPLTTLDTYIYSNNISRVEFIKIDAEGGELDVLKGGLKVLREIRPIVMCEIADIRTQQWGYKASEICQFLENCGYLWFQITPNGKIVFHKIKDRYDHAWENLIAVPIEKLDELENFREDI